MITAIEDYFTRGCGRCDRFDTAACSTRLWAEGLGSLREVCLAAGLEETVKWGQPCYMHAGRNIALIAAFIDDFRLSFFDAVLLDDPGKLLEKAGPNATVPGMLRFTGKADVDRFAPALADFLAQAKGHAAAGRRAPRVTREIELPAELVDCLDADPDLAEAFARLTPGRQRSYVIALASAKTSPTRIARISRFRDRIIGGKGANER